MVLILPKFEYFFVSCIKILKFIKRYLKRAEKRVWCRQIKYYVLFILKDIKNIYIYFTLFYQSCNEKKLTSKPLLNLIS